MEQAAGRWGAVLLKKPQTLRLPCPWPFTLGTQSCALQRLKTLRGEQKKPRSSASAVKKKLVHYPFSSFCKVVWLNLIEAGAGTDEEKGSC